MAHRQYEGMTGRQIVDSFGNLYHDYLFDKIRNLPNRFLIGKESLFSRCSTNPESESHYQATIQDLEKRKIPYRVVKRLEWFELNEEEQAKK